MKKLEGFYLKADYILERRRNIQGEKGGQLRDPWRDTVGEFGCEGRVFKAGRYGTNLKDRGMGR